jgi:hypothetical protein
LPSAEIGTAQQEIPVTKFWDPTKDSLWGVYEKGQCIYVYCSKLQAQFAAEDIGGKFEEIVNQELPDFWFYNAGLQLIR